MENLRCQCCRVSRRVRVGASVPYTCQDCRTHGGASADSRARRDAAHANAYFTLWQEAVTRAEKQSESLERAGWLINHLRSEVAEAIEAKDASDMQALIARIRKLHHIVLTSGRCACGRDARCPTLRLVETV